MIFENTDEKTINTTIVYTYTTNTIFTTNKNQIYDGSFTIGNNYLLNKSKKNGKSRKLIIKN